MSTGAATALNPAGFTERGVLFPCAGETLLGIVSAPAAPRTTATATATTTTPPTPTPTPAPESDLGLVIVVGGPQYRAGSHRLFVQLCRHLAAHGIPTLRFDVRGMGDSTGEQRPFHALSDDIEAAIGALQQAQRHVRRVVLWGLCDGASAALLYVHERADPRVAGLCLLNPWVRSEASLARAQVKHYYLDRLRQPEFWKKLASGQVAGKAVRELWANLRKASASSAKAPPSGSEATLPFQHRMALGLQRFAGPVQLVLSEHDYTAREFEEHTRADAAWRAALQRAGVERVALAGADHTLSGAGNGTRALAALVGWLDRLQGNLVPQPIREAA